ncbi:MAG: Ig-like domain-containing protein [bacterium]
MNKRITVCSFLMAAILSVSLACLLAGCGSSTDPNNPPPPAETGLSSSQRTILNNAADTFLALLQTETVATAKATLLADLGSTEGIASAALAGDSTTIWVDFDGGQVASIRVLDQFGEPPAYDPSNMVDRLEGTWPGKTIGSAKELSANLMSAKIDPGDFASTPTSRKVLLLSAAAEEFAGSDIWVFEHFRDYLVENHGWDPRDITIRYNREADDYSTLIFNDFLDLADYGVIIICAHSWMHDAPQHAPLDPRESLYVQVTAEEPYLALYDPHGHPDEPFDLDEEWDEGRVLFTVEIDPYKESRRSYLYMRDDLWVEHLGELPNSLVFLCIPNSAWLSEVFSDLEVGHTIVWDGIPATSDCSLNAAFLPLLMARDDATAIDIWDGGAIVPLISGDATLILKRRLLGLNAFFMPTWTFVGTRYHPSGTVSVKVELTSYTSTAVPMPEITVVQDVPHVGKEFEDLFPAEELTFKAMALDVDENVLAEVEETTTLAVGENVIVIDFDAYGIILTADPAWAEPDGVDTAEVTAVIRTFQPGDTNTPTGPTVAGKEVVFSTDAWATLVGTNPASTDMNGETSIEITALQEGTATVTARVEEDEIEASIEVEFAETEPNIYVWLTGSASTAGINYWNVDEPEHVIDAYEFLMDRWLNERQYNRYSFGNNRPLPLFNDGIVWAQPGDTMRFVFTATYNIFTGNPAQIGPLYIHYFREGGAGHRVKTVGTFSSTTAGEQFERILIID